MVETVGSPSVVDAWEPERYEWFRTERTAPFEDLLSLLRPVPGGRVVDLGCGTGELTVRLHRHLDAAATLGIDSSPAMLERAEGLGEPGVVFRPGDLASFDEPGRWDVVAANASLHWVPDHAAVLARWRASLRPGGQLAVQVPANADHPAHLLAAGLAGSAEFADAFGGPPPPDPASNVQAPEAYATLLDRLGFAGQHVRLQVYAHHLASTEEVVEWVRGTSLTRVRRVLAPADFDRFVARYRQRLLEVLGDQRPYFYAFKRILIWARLPAG